MIGYTDFATGAVPSDARLGWSSLVNPALGMAYITFFTGPAAAADDDFLLRFNEFWMQYGGRPFTPWAPYDGCDDLTYCLGTENAASAYAYGLDFSRKTKELLGAPTTVTIPAGGVKVLRYGTLFDEYQGAALSGGVDSVEGGGSSRDSRGSQLVAKSGSGHIQFNADTEFKALKALEKSA
jgi:hypothetical protein